MTKETKPKQVKGKDVDVSVSILDHFAEKSRRDRERMAWVRSHRKQIGVPQKYSDQHVSDVRTCFYASRGMEGFALTDVAVLFSTPVATVRNWIFQAHTRRAAAAQLNKDRIPYWKARMNAVLLKHKELEAQLLEERESSKPVQYSTAQMVRLKGLDKAHELIPGATESDYTKQVNDAADQDIFDALDQIIGRAPFNTMEVAEAVNHHIRSGNYMSHADAIALRKKYAVHHGL